MLYRNRYEIGYLQLVWFVKRNVISIRSVLCIYGCVYIFYCDKSFYDSYTIYRSVWFPTTRVLIGLIL